MERLRKKSAEQGRAQDQPRRHFSANPRLPQLLEECGKDPGARNNKGQLQDDGEEYMLHAPCPQYWIQAELASGAGTSWKLTILFASVVLMAEVSLVKIDMGLRRICKQGPGFERAVLQANSHDFVCCL